jgi:tRNA 2-selenouridine synthase
LAEAGVHYPLIEGGYKALRGYLLQQRQDLGALGKVILLSGATGVGKTALIEVWPNSIDLEGRAKHRGSAFGKTFVPQPAQIDWENQISIDWMRCVARSDDSVLVEAESHLIGRIHLPRDLQQAMARAPVVLLEATLEERTERLFQEYVVASLSHYKSIDVDPYHALDTSTLKNLGKIKKRLGGLRYQQLIALLEEAMTSLKSRNDPQGFYLLISTLLTDYYDPQYQHHQERNKSRIVMRGSMQEVISWLEDNALNERTACDKSTTAE